MFDTHCHLNFSAFDGILEKVISEAKNEGVEKFVVPGTDVETSKKAVAIAKKYEGVHAAVGIHPHHVKEIQNSKFKSQNDNLKFKINEIEKLLTHPKVVAIGEIGLDRHIYKKTKYEDYQIDEEFIALQKEVFLAQLNLAKKYKKTVIIHNRQAKDDLLKILTSNSQLVTSNRIVFHCCEPDFLETRNGASLLDFAKKNNIYIGVDGDVTYDPKKQAFVKEIPLSLLVLETDSPFLLPKIPKKTVFRKDCLYINTPKNLVLIAQKVAEIKGEKVEKIRKVTKNNAMKLFMIS
jgi:TatD DNase family protein